MWKTTAQTKVTAVDTGEEHTVATETKLIMLDDTGCEMKALLLQPQASPDGRLDAATHLVTLELESITCYKPVLVILRPGTERVSLKFERAHVSMELWERAIALLFPTPLQPPANIKMRSAHMTAGLIKPQCRSACISSRLG